MNPSDLPPLTNRELEAIESQAHAWVRRLTSGSARKSDADALRQWCATRPEHARAFHKAQQLWREMLPAAELAAQGDSELAALRAGIDTERPRSLPRRAFLGGALALSATAAGVAVVSPPWRPGFSLQSWRADYRTAVGERRTLTPVAHVTVEMNTLSSVTLRTVNGETVGVELIEGEAAIDASRALQPFTVIAGAGRAEARNARFEVRYLNDAVCMTCLEGELRVVHPISERTLQVAQQVRYDDQVMRDVLNVDLKEVSVWREGILSFHDTALTDVVVEINRYRSGRVILLGKSLGTLPVSGRFHIRDLDKAIVQIQRVFDLQVRALPGGIVVLS